MSYIDRMEAEEMKQSREAMRQYFKTFFHCLWHTLRFDMRHRMCYYRAAGQQHKEWFCECSPRHDEVMKEFNI